MVEMGGVCDGIVPLPVALVCDPKIAKGRDRPVSRWDVTKGMEEVGIEDKFVETKEREGGDSQEGKDSESHCWI